MVRTAKSLHASIDELARREAAFARLLEDKGRPEPRSSEPGVGTLLRTIVGQQVSVAAARSMWAKLTARFGEPVDLARLAQGRATQDLREAGLSRQKAGYARSLAGLVLSGELDLAKLPADDEEAIAELIKIKGIGRWSAEIYLLFAEGPARCLPGGRPRGADRARAPARPRRAAEREAGCANGRRRGGRTAARRRCSPGTATTTPARAL